MPEWRMRIDALQEDLGRAKDVGDTQAEIAALLDIADTALEHGDLGLANMHFRIATQVIKASGAQLHRLPDTLGARALIARRHRQYEKCLELYTEAAEAAREHGTAQQHALYVGKQGVIHRLSGNADAARGAFEESRRLFLELGDEGLGGVGEQEGHLGLLAADDGDDRAAELAYRRAVDLATAAGDNASLNTWAINAGDAVARRRRYWEAWEFYRRAMDAALRDGDAERLGRAEAAWSAALAGAHRWLEAGEKLMEASQHISSPEARCQGIEHALGRFERAGAWERIPELTGDLERLLQQIGADAERMNRCRGLANHAQRMLATSASDQPAHDGPTPLEEYIVGSMTQHQQAGDARGMMDRGSSRL